MLAVNPIGVVLNIVLMITTALADFSALLRRAVEQAGYKKGRVFPTHHKGYISIAYPAPQFVGERGRRCPAPGGRNELATIIVEGGGKNGVVGAVIAVWS